ncbi:MAG TPA: molybdate ABC transporter substrate-binding protein, partial [Bacteroidota bacterium]|nr:molybdate ABC transporter substrate-binding protein [Bacteroidota bacterium]
MRQETQISVLLASALIAAGMPARAQEPAREEIVVFAAASLHDAFQKIGREFSAAHPGLTVGYNFAGSQQLAEQILQGAPADVFASADMKQIAAAGPRMDTASVNIFTRNRLTLVLPGTGAGMIRAIADLGNPGIKLVLAHRDVPAGAYALEFLSRCEASGKFRGGFREAVLRNVVSYEENVRSVLSKIVLDEADAGIVYVSDVGGAAGRSVRTIGI